jgi:hypothetical protein
MVEDVTDAPSTIRDVPLSREHIAVVRSGGNTVAVDFDR